MERKAKLSQDVSELSGRLVWFSWEGCVRWPGVVVPPRPKSELLSGMGQFYPPKLSVFESAYVRDYSCGSQLEQKRAAGTQKVTKRKCRAVDPQGLLLVMSLGDEMYKWCRASSIQEPFRSKLDGETYSFPPGWGRKDKTFREHLCGFKEHAFDGKAALRAALEWQACEESTQKLKQEDEHRQRLFRKLHASQPISASEDDSFFTPPKRPRTSSSIASASGPAWL